MKINIIYPVVLLCVLSLAGGCAKEGCTDTRADNYTVGASKDDKSCTYTLIYDVVNTTGLKVDINYWDQDGYKTDSLAASGTWTKTVTSKGGGSTNGDFIGFLTAHSGNTNTAPVGTKVTATIILKDGTPCSSLVDEKTSTTDTDPAVEVMCQ